MTHTPLARGWMYGPERLIHYYLTVDASQAPTRLCDTTRHVPPADVPLLTSLKPLPAFSCKRCVAKLEIRHRAAVNRLSTNPND